MNKKILIVIVVSVGLTMFSAYSQRNPQQGKAEETRVEETKEEKTESDAQREDYTIISADKDTVKLKIAAGKTLYNVMLVSGTQSFTFKFISNESGDLKMPSGATAWPGSQLTHPDRMGFDFFLFPDEAVIKVFGFDATTDFKPQKVNIVSKKGEAVIEYSVKP